MANQDITDNFKYKELACKGDTTSCGGCQSLPITDLLYFHMDRLQELRVKFNSPLTITSGHRCERHNFHVGGAPNSMHLTLATDIRPAHYSGNMEKGLDEIGSIAKEMSFGGIGLYNSFVHIDSREFLDREIARWNNRN